MPILSEYLAAWGPHLCAAGAMGGGALWLVGARVSRSLVTLAALTAGGLVGMRLPGWFGWPIDSMCTGVASAILMGLAGFLLHTCWVGALLGLVMAVWAGAMTWAVSGASGTWEMPAVDWATGPRAVLATIWQSLPQPLNKLMPFACAAGFCGGVAVMVLHSKAGKVLAWTLFGLTLLIGLGAPAAEALRPDWLATVLPPRPAGRFGLLAGMVALGALVQWWMLRGRNTWERVEPSAATASSPAGGRPSMEPGFDGGDEDFDYDRAEDVEEVAA